MTAKLGEAVQDQPPDDANPLDLTYFSDTDETMEFTIEGIHEAYDDATSRKLPLSIALMSSAFATYGAIKNPSHLLLCVAATNLALGMAGTRWLDAQEEIYNDKLTRAFNGFEKRFRDVKRRDVISYYNKQIERGYRLDTDELSVMAKMPARMLEAATRDLNISVRQVRLALKKLDNGQAANPPTFASLHLDPSDPVHADLLLETLKLAMAQPVPEPDQNAAHVSTNTADVKMDGPLFRKELAKLAVQAVKFLTYGGILRSAKSHFASAAPLKPLPKQIVVKDLPSVTNLAQKLETYETAQGRLDLPAYARPVI